MLISNDRNTLIAFAFERLAAGEPVAGVIATTLKQSIGQAIEDIQLVAECMSEDEIRKQTVVYLPLS